LELLLTLETTASAFLAMCVVTCMCGVSCISLEAAATTAGASWFVHVVFSCCFLFYMMGEECKSKGIKNVVSAAVWSCSNKGYIEANALKQVNFKKC
jgi:hypothetical protein